MILLKKVLITGTNSYVGTNVEKWLMKKPGKYYVESLDMKDPNWMNFDFTKFDIVFHVAGIAHIKENKKNRNLYYKVNTDLAIQTAIIAKKSGIKHFIFMSSMSVYGKKKGIIRLNSECKPKSHYGKSKLNAEQELKKLDLNLTILRPPMIYGYQSTGNFQKLVKFSKYFLLLPTLKTKKSAIYISNFAHHIDVIIDNKITGVLTVQNNYYFDTVSILQMINETLLRKSYRFFILNPLVVLLCYVSPYVNKVFGSSYYDMDEFSKNNSIVNEQDSIQESILGIQ